VLGGYTVRLSGHGCCLRETQKMTLEPPSATDLLRRKGIDTAGTREDATSYRAIHPINPISDG
jgi:hypothetical protein